MKKWQTQTRLSAIGKMVLCLLIPFVITGCFAKGASGKIAKANTGQYYTNRIEIIELEDPPKGKVKNKDMARQYRDLRIRVKKDNIKKRQMLKYAEDQLE